MAKRANGEGSIFKLPNGTWRVQVEGRSGGKRKRRVRHAKTRTEAVRKLQELRGMSPTESGGKTVRTYLNEWLDKRAVNLNLAPSTIALYRNAIGKHIVPAIGSQIIDRVKAADVESLLDGISGARTRQIVMQVVYLAMERARQMDLIVKNPCDAVEKPTVVRKEVDPFTAEEAMAILAATADTRNYALFVLAFSCGMRQGEIFGLPRTCVDLRERKLKVETQATEVSGKLYIGRPKTENSVRTITLPQMAADALTAHYAIMLREGLAGSEIVFPGAMGAYQRRGIFRTRIWKPLLEELNITYRAPHQMRHTYATLALGAGVPVHVVSSVLGHSRPSTTLDLYSHAIPSQQDAAANTMQKLFA